MGTAVGPVLALTRAVRLAQPGIEGYDPATQPLTGAPLQLLVHRLHLVGVEPEIRAGQLGGTGPVVELKYSVGGWSPAAAPGIRWS